MYSSFILNDVIISKTSRRLRGDPVGSELLAGCPVDRFVTPVWIQSRRRNMGVICHGVPFHITVPLCIKSTMVTPSFFRFTGPLWRESYGYKGNPLVTIDSLNSPHKGSVMHRFDSGFMLACAGCWTNSPVAGNLWRLNCHVTSVTAVSVILISCEVHAKDFMHTVPTLVCFRVQTTCCLPLDAGLYYQPPITGYRVLMFYPYPSGSRHW